MNMNERKLEAGALKKKKKNDFVIFDIVIEIFIEHFIENVRMCRCSNPSLD